MNRQEALREAATLLKAANIADAYQEAELLLAHGLNIDRAALYATFSEPLTGDQHESYRRLVARRASGEPSAYITGHKEFFGLDFYVDSRVLIPRPETELLVEKALELVRSGHVSCREKSQAGTPVPPEQPLPGEELLPAEEPPTRKDFLPPEEVLIADIGTGSGAIAISLARNLPCARIYATDSSRDALEAAHLNCQQHGVLGQVILLRGDLLAPLPEPVDLIVANLPYIPTRVYLCLDKEIKDHEPELALHGGKEGLDLIFRLLMEAPSKMRPGASLLLEVAAGQAPEVVAFADTVFPSARKEVFQDLASLDRAVLIQTR